MTAHIPAPIRLPMEMAPQIAELLPGWEISVEVSTRYSTPYLEVVAISNPEEHDNGYDPIGFYLFYSSGYGWEIEPMHRRLSGIVLYDDTYGDSPATADVIVRKALEVCSLLRSRPDSKWNDDAVQFPRLLAEIAANIDYDPLLLSEAMDISITELASLFDRAQLAWEKAKREK